MNHSNKQYRDESGARTERSHEAVDTAGGSGGNPSLTDSFNSNSFPYSVSGSFIHEDLVNDSRKPAVRTLSVSSIFSQVK